MVLSIPQSLACLTIAASALTIACSPSHEASPPHPPDLSVFDIQRVESRSAAPPSAGPAPRRADAIVASAEAEATTSTTYAGWPATNALDGDDTTSWFSGENDSAAKGASPFFALRFPRPRTLHRVRVMGNRDPAYFDGFGVIRARLALFDGHGDLVGTVDGRGKGDRNDYDFELGELPNVQMIRFSSVEDEGAKNVWGDIAIGEIRIQ